MTVFKAYDIRGLYGTQIDATLAEKIGRAYVAEVSPRKVVVGHDMRACAPEIADAVINGIRACGVDVVRLGLASTPMHSFAVGYGKFSGGIQVTASHNPAEYIGMKLCRTRVVPLSRDEGIGAMEDRIKNGNLPGDAPKPGSLTVGDYVDAYVDMVAKHARFGRRLKIVADAGNGMGGFEFPLVAKSLDMEVIPLYFELDGNFPNHEANPLNLETLKELRATVQREGADFGVAFDGDADRAAFIDEKGGVVTNDLATALIAVDVLRTEKGPVVYDLRSSRALPEEIEKHGGTPIRGRVGHSFMKHAMRERKCVFGGEFSGHYYFRENYNTESASLAVVAMANIVSNGSKTLGERVDPLRRYVMTGEVNFRIEDKDAKMKELAETFSDSVTDWLDGVTCQYEKWWFNVRPSNTEPYLRLNLEADDQETFEAAKKRVFPILGDPT
ncbi:MAG: phosphomannomutase/phosphoglucomutase [Planctomycetota bacterium]|nr:phosphomannomutase/phosphoglucomutase [Planctomycetota bacterium]